jgi:hypothetical protein
MNGISKADWKLFMEKVPEWQETYMEGLIKEYIKMLQRKEPASTKFWDLAKRIKADKRSPGVQLQLNKDEAIFDIVTMINLGIITQEDLADFSDNLKESVQELIERNYGKW